MPRRLTAKETQLQSELKRINTRINALYKEGKRTRDMSVYEHYTQSLQTQEALNSGTVYYDKKGQIRVRQSPKQYNTQFGQHILNASRRVPTVTEVKKRAGNVKSFSEVNIWLEESERVKNMYTEFYDKIDSLYTDAELYSLIPELKATEEEREKGITGQRKNISIGKLLNRMTDEIKKRDDTFEKPKDIPFT